MARCTSCACQRAIDEALAAASGVPGGFATLGDDGLLDEDQEPNRLIAAPIISTAPIVIATTGVIHNVPGFSLAVPLSGDWTRMELSGEASHSVVQGSNQGSIIIQTEANVSVGGINLDWTVAARLRGFNIVFWIPPNTAAHTYRCCVYAVNNGNVTLIGDPSVPLSYAGTRIGAP